MCASQNASSPLTIRRESRDDHIVRLTLDRPEKHNALDRALVDDLLFALEEISRDDDVRVVLLTGAGDRAFCAGADIEQMVGSDPEDLRDFLRATRRLFRKLAEFPLPTIAALNGHAHGGGAELACACDLRIGCDSTTFRFPGVVYGMAVSTWQLPALIGIPRAKELLYTAATIGAEECHRIGLINRLVPSTQLVEVAAEIARSIAEHPRDAIASVKTLVDRNVGAPLTQRFYRELYSNQDRGVAGGAGDAQARFAAFVERKRDD